MMGRAPRFVKAEAPQQSTPLATLIAAIDKCTSATTLWNMFDRVILMGGDITADQMQALEGTWSKRYTLVCKQYGVHS